MQNAQRDQLTESSLNRRWELRSEDQTGRDRGSVAYCGNEFIYDPWQLNFRAGATSRPDERE